MSENTYMQVVKNELTKRNIEYQDCLFGIQFSTGLDSWIIGIADTIEGMAMPILYHRNLFKTKGAQDYHVQMKRPIAPWNLVNYTVNHQEKYATRMIG